MRAYRPLIYSKCTLGQKHIKLSFFGRSEQPLLKWLMMKCQVILVSKRPIRKFLTTSLARHKKSVKIC